MEVEAFPALRLEESEVAAVVAPIPLAEEWRIFGRHWKLVMRNMLLFLDVIYVLANK